MLLSMAFMLGMMVTAGSVHADFTFGEPVNLRTVIPFINPMYDTVDCLSCDGLEMYIDTASGGGDIWVLKRDSIDDDWGAPENLGSSINTPDEDSFSSISTDGLTLYFSSNRPGGNGQYDIYMTTRATRDSPWGQVVNMGPELNSSDTDGEPWISSDDLELYFESFRPGGYGKADIYVTKRKTQNDPWGPLENLGPVVNGPYNEQLLSLSQDGLLLLFSDHPFQDTPRPDGYGGADMWMSRRVSLFEPWQEPVNLGPRVNSSEHDCEPRISPDGRILYFWSFRNGPWETYQAPIIPICDFNGDGAVDAADMSIMVEHWGTDESLCDVGPMPWGDGIVDVQDLIVLSEHLFEGLIAHWKMDETEGIFAQDSAGENDAYIIGDPVWQPASGQVDGAIQLDGVDDCIITNPVLNPAAGTFSVLCWIKGGAPGQVILSQMSAANWLCTDSLDGNLMTELKGPGGSGGPLLSQTVITDGEWHRIGLVYDGLHRKLNVDGVTLTEDTLDGLEGSENGLYIGTNKTMEPGTYWSGLIDDVRIYNRVMKP